MERWIDEIVSGAASTAAAYVVVLLVVRAAGRRTVSEMSAFDAVITIALGSLLAQTSTSGTGLVRGLVAITVLLVLQVAIAWIRARSARAERWVGFEPRVVVLNGKVRTRELSGGLSGPQITERELFAMLRERGVEELANVRVAVVEATGSLSVLEDVADAPPLWRPGAPVRSRSEGR